MKQEMVVNWMTKTPVTISQDASLLKADEVLQKHDVRRLLVLDSNKRLTGIVTIGDIREGFPLDSASLTPAELEDALAKISVSHVMTPNPITIFSDYTIAQAANFMLENKVSGLPVVDINGGLAGIITESDIFRLVVQHWTEEEER